MSCARHLEEPSHETRPESSRHSPCMRTPSHLSIKHQRNFQN